MASNIVTEESESDELLQPPDIAVATVDHLPMIKLEHHIVYSPGYQVPVLYFNGYDPGNLPQAQLRMRGQTDNL